MDKRQKVIRLTESDLHDIVKESVERILKESGHEWWREEDWNPNHPDYVGSEDEDDDNFDAEEYYKKKYGGELHY